MHCKYHPNVEAVIRCQVCTSPLCPDCVVDINSKTPQCEKCSSFDELADIGETTARNAEERRKQVESSQIIAKKSINWRAVQIGIIVFAFAFVPFQYYQLTGEHEPPPLNKNNIAEMTDICIATLMRISLVLKQSQLPGDAYRCPISDHPFVTTYKGSDIIVSDPNPELHGLSVFRVSKQGPGPVFIE